MNLCKNIASVLSEKVKHIHITSECIKDNLKTKPGVKDNRWAYWLWLVQNLPLFFLIRQRHVKNRDRRLLAYQHAGKFTQGACNGHAVKNKWLSVILKETINCPYNFDCSLQNLLFPALSSWSRVKFKSGSSEKRCPAWSVWVISKNLSKNVWNYSWKLWKDGHSIVPFIWQKQLKATRDCLL